MNVQAMQGFRRVRNLIGLSCLLALAACATTPPTPTTSDAAAATVDQDESRAPAVSSIAFRGSPTSDDTYGLGETVEVSVEFDRAVTATGNSQVALTIGAQTRRATLSSWSRQSLQFSYTVQEDDRDEDGVGIAGNSLLLNGGTITSADGTIDADLTHEAVAAERDTKVNGSLSTRPGVTHIAFSSFPSRGDTYGLGETVEVRVEFDRAVTAAGQPQVALTIGTQTRHATLYGWGRQALSFAYTVQEDDRDDDGISIAANALALNGGTIRAIVGTTDVDLSHDAVAADGTKVNGSDNTPPRVSDISFRSSPARGDTYELGEIIEVRFEFDRAVTATGRPQVALAIGTQTRRAAFYSWGRQTLYFTYAVQEDDRDDDGISIAANALTLSGGTIKSADNTVDADLKHGPVAAERGNKVNGSESTPPAVSDIAFNSSPARGDTYGLGETIAVRVEFDRAVAATGRPQVALTIGTRTGHAILSAWSTQSMHFEYTVQGPDRDEDGISIPANALLLNGGTIKSADGTTDADLTHGPIADQRRSKVNGGSSIPTGVRHISFISSPAKGDTYRLGETVELAVEFDRAVAPTGSPQVALTIGAQTRHAYFSGWGRQFLYFDYLVHEADRDEDGISIAANALALNGGTIKSADGTTDADLTHGPVAADPGRKVNGSGSTPPGLRRISFISFPARGDTYGLGETIEVRVEFDAAVTVVGTPQVALTIGTQTRPAAYSASRGDPRYAHFSYAVQEGDRDEDGISIRASALALNGGAIKHAGDRITDADLAHDAVASDPNNRVNGSLVTRPVVRAIYFDNHVPPPSGDTYVRGERVRVWVEFDGDVIVTGSPQVELTIGSRTRRATYSGYSAYTVPGFVGTFVDEDVLSFDYLVQATDRDEDGISIPANALIVIGGAITATDGTTDADLGHDAVAADPGRKVNGSRVTP